MATDKETKELLKDKDVEVLPTGAPATSVVDPTVAFANSSQASTGEVVEVPKTPKEIAEQGTKLAEAGDFSTGGSPVNPSGDPSQPVYARVWGMDTDHTTNNRYQPDALNPDCSVRVS